MTYQGSAGTPLSALLANYLESAKWPDVVIHGLQLDSRAVRPGDLFVALKGGKAHGLHYAAEAVRNGCAAILYEPEWPEEIGSIDTIPVMAMNSLADRLGSIADQFFGQPSRDLDVIGITGTNGKTSCSHFLAEALGMSAQAAVVGTLGWGIPGQLQPTSHTTPDAIEVHRLLGQLRSSGFKTVAMETSSHGLAQGRLHGVRFKGALFTNFSRDHLDYHGTLDSYLAAKMRLMDCPGLDFVAFNTDELIAEPVLQHLRAGQAYIGFGPAPLSARPDVPVVTFESVRYTNRGVDFTVRYLGQSAAVSAAVFGKFNVENITAVVAVMIGLGSSLGEAATAVMQIQPVPGRMEHIHNRGRGAVIDYAHTPDALLGALNSMRQHGAGKLWLVFGCGGDRDRGKRAEMGKIADRLADVIVLTDDNPRSENGDQIIEDILLGIDRQDIMIIRSRREAINYALESADAADMVLIAGKGHETTQEIQGNKYPFSDREAVESILGKLASVAK